MFELFKRIKSAPRASWLGSLLNQYPMDRVGPRLPLLINELSGAPPMIRGTWSRGGASCPLRTVAIGYGAYRLKSEHPDAPDEVIWEWAAQDATILDPLDASPMVHSPVAYIRGYTDGVDGRPLGDVRRERDAEYPSPLVYLLGRFDGYRMRRFL